MNFICKLISKYTLGRSKRLDIQNYHQFFGHQALKSGNKRMLFSMIKKLGYSKKNTSVWDVPIVRKYAWKTPLRWSVS